MLGMNSICPSSPFARLKPYVSVEATAFDHENAVVAVIESAVRPAVTVKVSVTVTALAFVAGQPPETSQTIRAVATIGDPTMTEVVVSQ